MNLKLETFCLTLIFITGSVNLIEVEQELTITASEKIALDTLKTRLRQIETQEWLKTDLALLRWLRSKDLNIDKAEAAFKSNIKWRIENKIDSILDEDWTYFKEEYYFDDTGTDYSGRPVIQGDITNWDVRASVVSGKGEKLLRYMIRGIESVAKRVRDLQSAKQNVTQWKVIINLDNFNYFQNGCFGCLPIYIQFLLAHENYYPNGADKIVLINTPAAFEVVLNILRPLMSPPMRNSLTVFGTNKAEWRKYVLSVFPEDQLGKHFGGTKD